MGKRDDHNRVAIWTKCRRMDKLLTKVPYFRLPTSTETHRQNELFFRLLLFRAGPRLGISLQKKVSANLENDAPLGAPWFIGSRRAHCSNGDLTF
jgi:hypothetical protein